MNPDKILENYPPGDAQAALMLRAAEQLEAAITEGPGWSMALGTQLFDLLSWVEFHFPDGTALNIGDKYESILGDTGAGLIVSALDPEGRDSLWWEYEGRSATLGAPEMIAADADIRAALANSNIRLADT
jgi:hypothetical protein